MNFYSHVQQWLETAKLKNFYQVSWAVEALMRGEAHFKINGRIVSIGEWARW